MENDKGRLKLAQSITNFILKWTFLINAKNIQLTGGDETKNVWKEQKDSLNVWICK